MEYLADLWDRCGRSLSLGMGRAPLSWAELAAMAHIIKIDLRPWEAETIMRMSRDYCAQSYSEKDDPAPYAPTDDPRALAVERGHQNEHTRG